jgi:hypothetical protein
MDDRKTTTLELLDAIQSALNQIPRRKLRGLPNFKDTYELAAEVDRHVGRAQENKEEGDA